MPRMKKSEVLYKEIQDFTSASEETIKAAFENLVRKQEAHHELFKISMEANSVNIFQNLYVNEIQVSLLDNYHCHNYYEVNYINTGTCWQYVEGDLLKMSEGDFLIMSPDVKHSCYLAPKSKGRNIFIRMSLLDRIAEELSGVSKGNFLQALRSKHTYFLFRACGNDFLSALFKELCGYSYAIFNPNTIQSVNADRLISLLLWETQSFVEKGTIDYISGVKVRQKKKTAVDFNDITQYIKENIATVKRTDLEEHFGYSSTSLCRIMKENGTTFRDYLGIVREQKAIELLKNTNYSMQKIAQLLGFSSSENFCHFFTQRKHYSPNNYRKAYRRSGKVDGAGDHEHYFF